MCYLYSTGSVRVRLEADQTFNVDTELWLRSFGPSDIVTVFANSAISTLMWVNNHLSSGNVEGNVHDVVVPCYNHKLARLNMAQLANTSTASIGLINGASGVTLNFYQSSGTPVAYNASVSRSAGDDFALFGWLGTVPMINRGTN